jgi:uncharacterized membrane protein YoaK (UPF0700 family)
VLLYRGIGLFLTALAGWVDALGFLELGGFYPSFMSGNTTQLGVGIGAGRPELMPLLLIAGFFSGAFAASLLATVSERWRLSRVLSLVAALIAVALAMSWKFGDAPAMEVLAAAMGAQNATRLADPNGRLGLTYVTGQLYASARDLALRLAHKRRTAWLMPLLMWAALLVGAAAGSLAHMALGTKALVVPLLGLALAAAFTARRIQFE